MTLPRNSGLELDEAKAFYTRLFVDGEIEFAEPENGMFLTEEEKRENQVAYDTFILRLMQGRITPADLGYPNWEPR